MKRCSISTLAQQVQSRTRVRPEVALLLGTGLAELCDHIDVDATIPYTDLEGMLQTARIITLVRSVGQLSGKSVVAFNGRLHCYEGHAPAAVLRLFASLMLSVLIP